MACTGHAMSRANSAAAPRSSLFVWLLVRVVASVALIPSLVRSFVHLSTCRHRQSIETEFCPQFLSGTNVDDDTAMSFGEEEEAQRSLKNCTDNNGVTTDSAIPSNDDPIRCLFAWIARAISGDERYDDIGVALSTIFGRPARDSEQYIMLSEAMSLLPSNEDQPTGIVIPIEERRLNSLGPLGAGQWSGQLKEKFPHSLLDVKDLENISEWENALPRTCRQNLRKAASMNYSVLASPITGDAPAPQSSLSHFRCIVEHQVRLGVRKAAISTGDCNVDNEIDAVAYFDALCQAVCRFVGSTRMAGTIYEYRLNERIVMFIHEVQKGHVLRGQWCYLNDEASTSFGWFRAVRDLVGRAVEDDCIDVVDLGPNGSSGRLGSHAELKRRYGFDLIEDWPMVADYRGPFF
mmetsp:Transcript_26478/g.58044  ORF Transcript_26478/g.58044 Transcript_26478/m.58044 type:complete len:406 (+) Transcript_26478:70-1287(+)